MRRCTMFMGITKVLTTCLAVFLATNTPMAAPVDCPDFPPEIRLTAGDIFIASTRNPLQRIRQGFGGAVNPAKLVPDRDLSVYYFANPQSLTEPMIFALLRVYKLSRLTSLSEETVYVSNSLSKERPVSASDYKYFHSENRDGPHVLRHALHLRFRDSLLDQRNSYDVVSNPQIYLFHGDGDGLKGFKARMQRISGFPADGRCVIFTLFDSEAFANAVTSLSAVLTAVSDQAADPDIAEIKLVFGAVP